MKKNPLSARHLTAVAGMALVIGSCGAPTEIDLPQGSDSAPPAPPAALSGAPPLGKVIIPGGRTVDRECVFEAPDDALVTFEGDVIVKGKVIAHHAPCSPEQMGMGKPGDSSSELLAPTISHAWVEWSSAANATYYAHLVANWTVPPAPTSTANKIIYLFPSFESSWHGGEIIQPVLQYGGNGDFGGNYWTMASWYCYPNGCKHSGAKNVNVGDLLQGNIDFVKPTGPSTVEYQITTRDQSTGVGTALLINTNGPFNTVQGGALEVYGVSTCSQYPAAPLVQFYNEAIYDSTETLVHPFWTGNVDSTLTPQCGYGVRTGISSNSTDFTMLFFVNS
jgi:hypothetical protein